MKLAILQCDELKNKWTKYGQYNDQLYTLLSPHCPDLTVTVFKSEQGELPQDIHKADAYLITGSRYGVNEDLAWIGALENFIRVLDGFKKKIVGICFGHQIIAKALGGKVIKWPKGWAVGIAQNEINHVKPWMNPIQKKFNLLVSHQDQVVQLPKKADVLASNVFCPYFMLNMGSHILSIQGHPEYTKNYLKDLIHFRAPLLGKKRVEHGLMSLTLPEDSLLIAQWIINFLKS